MAFIKRNHEEIAADLNLHTERVANNELLKRRFEDIFRKYGKDFKVADEIDLKTGAIVVDKGHVAGMTHEGDVGDGDNSR